MKVKLGGSVKRGPGLRPPRKTPKYRLRQKLRASGFTKKQAFRVTKQLSRGGTRRKNQLSNLRHYGPKGSARMGRKVVFHHRSPRPVSLNSGRRRRF